VGSLKPSGIVKEKKVTFTRPVGMADNELQQGICQEREEHHMTKACVFYEEGALPLMLHY